MLKTSTNLTRHEQTSFDPYFIPSRGRLHYHPPRLRWDGVFDPLSRQRHSFLYTFRFSTVLGYGPDDRDFTVRLPMGARDFIFPKAPRPALCLTQLFISYVWGGGGVLDVRRTAHESDHWASPAGQVKSEWNCTSSCLYDFMTCTGLTVRTFCIFTSFVISTT